MVLYRYNIVLEKMGIHYRSIHFPWIPLNHKKLVEYSLGIISKNIISDYHIFNTLLQ